MKYTTNLQLKKPDYVDPADIGILNENMDIVDAELKKVEAHLGDMTQVPTTSKTASGAISELFTNVDNGKNAISGAITDVDSNVVIPTNPSFSELAIAIGQISTGKKWAVGNTSAVNGILAVNGLTFRPKFIFILYGGAISSAQAKMFAYTDGTIVPMMLGRKAWRATSNAYITQIDSELTINDDGFILNGSTSIVWGNLDWLALD